MTNEQMTQLLARYWDATINMDFDQIGTHLTEDFTVWFVPSAREQGLPSPMVGRDTFLAFMRQRAQRQGGYEPRSATPLHTYFNEDAVALHLRLIGDYPNGFVYDNEYVFLYKFRDGKIAEMREFTDAAYIGLLARRAAQGGNTAQ